MSALGDDGAVALPAAGVTAAPPATPARPGRGRPLPPRRPGVRRTGSLAGGAGLRPGDHACWSRPGRRRPLAPSYELRADLLVARLPAVALCGYDLRVVDDAAVELPTAVHPLRLGAGDTPGPGFQLHGTADGALALRGEVDMLYSDTVAGLLGGSAGDLGVPVVDVSSLEFVDVAGMRAIAAAARALPATGVAVEVRGGSPLFRRVWSVLGHDALQRVRLT